MMVSTFSVVVRPWVSASTSYSSRKLASESFSFPEKNGALFERGPGIAATPEVDMAQKMAVGDDGGRGGTGGSTFGNGNELGDRVENGGGHGKYEVERERILW